MNQEANNIWIDMSDFSVWKGHFTGIQRVVYNIAKQYKPLGANYFYYDSNQNKFYEFNFDNFCITYEASKVNRTEQAQSKKVKAIILAKELYRRSPRQVKGAISPRFVKKVGRKSLAVYSGFATKAKSLSKGPNTVSRVEVNFKAGTKVLILGNSWDRPELLLEIKRLKQKKGFKLFQIVYDLIPTFQPQSFNKDLYTVFTNNIFEVVTTSDGLMAISNSTKKDMVRFCEELSIECPPIEVIRLGDNIPVSSTPTAPAELCFRDDFVICVGTIEARKNHTLLYYAWKEGYRRGYKMPKLVIIGRPGWYTQDIVHTFKNDLQTINSVIILSNTSDDELVWLYENCKFTVYPSYYEGWGLPVAESLAMGKVCVTTNVSSMPEIINGIIETSSPFDSGQFAELVNKLSEQDELKCAEDRIKGKYTSANWDITFRCVDNFVSTF